MCMLKKRKRLVATLMKKYFQRKALMKRIYLISPRIQSPTMMLNVSVNYCKMDKMFLCLHLVLINKCKWIYQIMINRYIPYQNTLAFNQWDMKTKGRTLIRTVVTRKENILNTNRRRTSTFISPDKYRKISRTILRLT